MKEFELDGIGKLISVLEKAGDKAPLTLARALVDEANEIFDISQQQVPVDTNVLRSSGMVHNPVISQNEIMVEISYGGGAKAYAMRQHENESYNHAPGKKAKYLYDPVKDRIPKLADHLADRIMAMIRGLI